MPYNEFQSTEPMAIACFDLGCCGGLATLDRFRFRELMDTTSGWRKPQTTDILGTCQNAGSDVAGYACPYRAVLSVCVPNGTTEPQRHRGVRTLLLGPPDLKVPHELREVKRSASA
jgi:hypothetical protein